MRKKLLLDKTTAKQFVIIVKNDGLSWRHRTLRLRENGFNFITFDMQYGLRRRCRIAYLRKNGFAVVSGRVSVCKNMIR